MRTQKVIINEYQHRYYLDSGIFANEKDAIICSVPIDNNILQTFDDETLYNLTLLVSRAYKMGREHEAKAWKNKIKNMFDLGD